MGAKKSRRSQAWFGRDGKMGFYRSWAKNRGIPHDQFDAPPMKRGYWKLYLEHVNQASEGADLDSLVGRGGTGVPRDNH